MVFQADEGDLCSIKTTCSKYERVFFSVYHKKSMLRIFLIEYLIAQGSDTGTSVRLSNLFLFSLVTSQPDDFM